MCKRTLPKRFLNSQPENEISDDKCNAPGREYFDEMFFEILFEYAIQFLEKAAILRV